MKSLWMISVIVLGFSQVNMAKNLAHLPCEKLAHIKAEQAPLINMTRKPANSFERDKHIAKTTVSIKRTTADFNLSAFTSLLSVNHYHFGVSISLLLLCITYFINTAILND